MKQSQTILLTVLLLIALTVGTVYIFKKDNLVPTTKAEEEKTVIINEAARTLLYLPLYHAKEAGFFEKNGLNVEIVTGGTATNSFAAMTSGEAQFSQADPMYVPISNEKNADTRVIAQIVSKIAIWGVTLDSTVKVMDKSAIKGEIISTHIRPMSAYTYTMKTIKDYGLVPDKDVQVLQNKPGSEIAPMLLGQAKFAITVEPSVSIATNQGARIVLSYPQIFGEQILTGLMARQDYIEQHKDIVLAVLKSYQESLNDIYTNRDAALRTALQYFPQLKPEIVKTALNHVLDEGVIPRSILMSEESWNKAIDVRVKAGDLKTATTREQNVRLDLISKVLEGLKQK